MKGCMNNWFSLSDSVQFLALIKQDPACIVDLHRLYLKTVLHILYGILRGITYLICCIVYLRDLYCIPRIINNVNNSNKNHGSLQVPEETSDESVLFRSQSERL